MKELFKNDRTLAVKKCIAFALVLFGMIFVLVNKGVYYSQHTDRVKLSKEQMASPDVVEFEGDKTFEQEFRGWNGTLTSISLRFSNQGNQAASGNVTLNVLDQNGKVLCSTEKPVSSVRTTKRSNFQFEEPVVLSHDQQYVLQVVVKDAHNEQGFGLLIYPEKKDLFGTLKADGKEIADRLGATFYYSYYNMGAVRHMYAFFILALLFICIPFGRLDDAIEKKWGKKVDTNRLVSRLFFLATPVLCYMMADRFNGFSIMQMLRRMPSWRFVFNMLIYATLWLIIYTVINRTQYASMLLLLIAFIADMANYYVWIFRGCPILATDLQSAKTAMNVAQNFSYSLDLTGVWGVVYIITFSSMLLSLKGYRGVSWKKRLVFVAGCFAMVWGFNTVFFNTDIVSRCHVKAEVWHPQQKYAKNGTALSFVLSWSYTKVEKPSGYAADKVKDIVKDFASDAVSDPGDTVRPNIIAIMNESLADLSYDGKIDFSEDYLPFLHSLEKNTVKGKLYVSIEGANTANSEFEFLTGNSMTFLPFRCIPYNLYIKDKTPSMAHNLSAQGYSGVNAYHPYLSSGWNRTNVYPLLGFHNFYAQEYFYDNGNDDLVRNYISDASDFKQITDDYEKAKRESDAPFYLFNVTMQNHGGYDGKRGYVDTDITIEDEELRHAEAEQYINLAKKSDDAFKQLVEYFEKVDEPTLIVMFGDHQPPISNTFYSAMFGKSVDNLPTKDQANWYATPYVIWANYDIEAKDLDMSANYLSSYVMNLAGLELTGYNKYLLNLQKTLPVISAVCYMDADGNVYANDEESKYSDLIREYQMIQYNELFDEDNRLNDFFFLRSE